MFCHLCGCCFSFKVPKWIVSYREGLLKKWQKKKKISLFIQQIFTKCLLCIRYCNVYNSKNKRINPVLMGEARGFYKPDEKWLCVYRDLRQYSQADDQRLTSGYWKARESGYELLISKPAAYSFRWLELINRVVRDQRVIITEHSI